jgi:hypothetical protein
VLTGPLIVCFCVCLCRRRVLPAAAVSAAGVHNRARDLPAAAEEGESNLHCLMLTGRPLLLPLHDQSAVLARFALRLCRRKRWVPSG